MLLEKLKEAIEYQITHNKKSMMYAMLINEYDQIQLFTQEFDINFIKQNKLTLKDLQEWLNLHELKILGVDDHMPRFKQGR